MDTNERKGLPLLPLKNVVLLPKSIVPIIVGRSLSLKTVEHALKDNKEIIVTAQKDPDQELPEHKDLYSYGTHASILQVMRMPKGTLKLLIEGIDRVKITEVTSYDDRLEAAYEELVTEAGDASLETSALWRHLQTLYKKYASLNTKIPNDITNNIKTAEDIGIAADTIAVHSNLSFIERQSILEETDLKERLLKLCTILQKEIDILETEERIRGHVQNQVEKSQREYYLNEQIKAIHKELGRDEQADILALLEKSEALDLPAEVDEKVSKELKRLEMMPALSSEAVVIRNYIEWIVSLPWNKTSKDRVSLKQAEKILNKQHAGLEKPKERIIEFLAAKKFNPSLKYTPTICLVGPPGVGKTSLGKSVAEALGREFVRISLGGTRDEAEIRGHRRTYIGALPGKIIQAMRKAKTTNPLILLDEIDKMSTDLHGDPAAALLEVLDPEQNNAFVDNFLEVGYDLSKVMFLATANHPDGIPYPLYDRMEVISLSGYTDTEKLDITQKFLIPKHLREHGLTAQQCKIPQKILKQIISEYTKEAGVRQLERIITKLVRKVIQVFLHDKTTESVTVTEQLCKEWLGNPPFKKKPLEALKKQIGFATGLAWTELGGDVLEIETTTVPGKGELTLTGQLGEVMQESAQAALSYIRSRADELGIKKSFFSSHDIHVHVPEGATPKDGPSAGITMCTALISALTNTPIKPAIAMTGEVTLRGRVLPVGGLKEKILAAQQHGITTILLPEENKDDVLKLQKELNKDVSIHFVETMDQVLKHTLSTEVSKKKQKTV